MTPPGMCAKYARIGAVAQLGERVVRNDEVRGSIPLGSTSFLDNILILTENLQGVKGACPNSLFRNLAKIFGPTRVGV